MGNEMAKVLAESLKTLPYIESINLTDNNLTCDGLTAIFNILQYIPNLTSLDVADNAISEQSASALAQYLCTPNCSLVKLGLCHADVDDGVS